MSRLGKKPIEIPQNVEIEISENNVNVKGPKGELNINFLPEFVSIKKDDDGNIILEPQKDDKKSLSLWGTYASHIINLIQGVQDPFVKKVVIEGVGYRAEMKGENVVLNVGYSHPIELVPPQGIAVEIQKNEITISGISKEAVGQFAARIRSQKTPEPYKGKGIRYIDEVVRIKQGKKTA